jgi:hypothetical protein
VFAKFDGLQVGNTALVISGVVTRRQGNHRDFPGAYSSPPVAATRPDGPAPTITRRPP